MLVVLLLKARRNTSVDQNYLAAGKVRLELEKQASIVHKKIINEAKSRHRIERSNLEDQFDNELMLYKQFWNTKVADFERTCQGIREELEARHVEDKEKHEENLKANLHMKASMTPEVVNTEYQINKLVKAQRYFEADRLMKKSEKIVNGGHKESYLKKECG